MSRSCNNCDGPVEPGWILCTTCRGLTPSDAVSMVKLRELADYFARQQLDESPASPTIDPLFAARDSGYRAGRNDGMRSAAKALRALIETGGLALVALLFMACATDPAAAGDVYGLHTAQWSIATVVDGDRSYTITCGDVSAHPCPLATHATAIELEPDAITWTAIVGVDANGATLADRDEEASITVGADGSLVIAPGSDDGGLRAAAVLAPTDRGWSGPISWDLTAIAGVTTFTLDVSR